MDINGLNWLLTIFAFSRRSTFGGSNTVDDSVLTPIKLELNQISNVLM